MQQEITVINDVIKLDRDSLIKGFLYIKLLSKGITLSNNDLSTLSVLLKYDDIDDIVKEVIARGYKKTVPSVLNTISLFVKKGVVTKKGIKKREIAESIVGDNISDRVAVTLRIHNIETYAATR